MTVHLRATVHATRDALDLTYQIDNESDDVLGVFDAIPWLRPDGTMAFPTSSAYVELVHDVLLLRKRALPIPRGLHPRAPALPTVRCVPAGGSCSGRIFLHIPIVVMQPIRAAALRLQHAAELVADAPAKAKLLRLEIGCFALHPRMRLIPEHPAHPGVLSVFPPEAAIAAQQVLHFDTALPRTIGVHDYRAVPWNDV